jgi:succinoglycan biosynthesis protein ExoM
MKAVGAALVVIPTRGRRDIEPILQRLSVQVAAEGSMVEVTILDNSGNAGADWSALATRYHCTWHVVPQPGLARVRNAAIDLLQQHHQALIFLDDDERPEPTWLHAILTAHVKFGGTVVIGPVNVAVPKDAPSWLAGGRFWRSEVVCPDGPVETEGYSGNTLIDGEFLRRTALRFDPAFDHTGGEDTDFFRRLRMAGGSVVWARDAAVIEHLDAERTTVRAVTHRAFHAANLSWRLDHDGLPHGLRAKMFLRRAARLPRGASRLATGLVALRPDQMVRGLCDCAAAIGTVSSVLGVRTEYYR